MKLICTFSMAAVLVHGCSPIHRDQPKTTHTIFVLDSTASVVPASFGQAIKAIDGQANQMERGDCITIVPIISTSVSIPSDEIIRGCAPAQRQPYDQDLKVFRDQLHKSIEHEAQALSAVKAVKTDILGTIDLVDQELALDPGGVRQRVVVFSDFIEEDDSRNFIRATELSDVGTAATLARDLAYRKAAAGQKPTAWTGVPILLAGLQSFDLPRLPEQRRQGIRQFWMEYFETRNAAPAYVNDGPGMSGRFLAH